MVEFAQIWNPMPKVVFSSTLDSVDWNSRLVRGDVGDEIERLRAEVDGEVDVGGPTLAAEAIRRGLVDEYRLVVHPVVLGAGTPFFPALDRPLALRLHETRRFTSGAVYLGYASDAGA
jgi:dihydrofolate reductase